MNLLESLNEAQSEAVTHIDGALLILAGAGSGKTKTLTTRLAHILGEVGIPPQNTLTLTFTNKAAKEMQERAIKLIHDMQLPIVATPLLCTFHKFGLLFLQRYIHILNRTPLFNIIDDDDKKRILKNIKKEYVNANILHTPSDLSNKISNYKNNFFSQNNANSLTDPIMASIYKKYDSYLYENNLVDFDDLLLLPYKILLENEELRIKISSKYKYIMVDEYQDTNDLQAALLMQLCATHENLCVVGDDDQSIYSWRGANIENILRFDERFSNTKVIKLEQNYRSTKQILDVANNLIAHNIERHSKILKSIKPHGNEVYYIKSHNDKLEMAKIIESINKLVSEGNRYEDIAILFRLNALARNVEDCLNRAKIPFKMIGIIRFYERQEIKDVLAYLRLAYNLHDNFSFTRVINRPRRGIGDKSLSEILQISSDYQSVYAAFKMDALDKLKNYKKLKEFFDLMESLRKCINMNPSNIADFFYTKIKLYTDDNTSIKQEENIERRQNIEEFFVLLSNHIRENEDMGTYENNEEMIQGFLNEVALSSSSDAEESNGVFCMSIHNSKGLEFKHVFVIGLEEGLCPLIYFDDSEFLSHNELAEERRLAYVAFTRAKDTLTLSYSKSRFYRNTKKDFEPSRFLVESGVVSEKEAGFNMIQNETTYNLHKKQENQKLSLQDTNEFKRGDCIKHKIFGFGRIESLQGSGTHAKATINFGGTKRVILTSFITKA